MIKFRKRIDITGMLKSINEVDEEPQKRISHGQRRELRTLMIDVTHTLADIRYSTDLRLLNEGRDKMEGIVDMPL